MIQPNATHSLVLDTVLVSFSLFYGTEKQCNTEHKKWSKKIKATKWVKMPGDSLSEIHTQHIVALRVTELPPEIQAANRLANDPRNVKFVEQATGFARNVPAANSGDEGGADMGYK